MIRRFGMAFRLMLVAADFVVALAIIGALASLRTADWPAVERSGGPTLVPYAIAYALGWVAVLALHGLYQLRARWTIRSEVIGILRSILLLAVATAAVLFVLADPVINRYFLLAVFATQAWAAVAARILLRAFVQAIRTRGRNQRNVLIVGTGETGAAFARRLDAHPDMGLRIEGFLGDPDELTGPWPYLGTVGQLPEVLHGRVVDEVAICLPIERWRLVEETIALCRQEGKIVRLPMTALDQPAVSRYVEDLDGMPVISLVTGPDRLAALMLKRLLDLAGAVVGLLVLSPVFALAAAVIVATDGRPVFFRQVRAGLNGRQFRIVKFRTMERNADARRAELRAFNEVTGNASFKMTNDPRITRIGRLLRRTSVDELPQLWNVLRGEMSLVGPRPHPLDDVAGYDDWHRRRLSMKPGITGLWQIGGRRETDFDRWVEKDLEYIDHWSFWLDVRVILMTIPALLRAEGR
ncbi:MAG TPA: sugar transferase [Candidatus Limnocylindrales bacterium]